MIKITVAVITSGSRPRQLQRLLESLENQKGRNLTFQLTVALVDNATLPSLNLKSFPTGLEIATAHEAQRGIPFARNRSLTIAQEFAPDFIAFIDDDEQASRTWLTEALRVVQEYKADAVAGRVEYDFALPVPAWRRLGGFYDSPTQNTGDPLPFARTGNLIVSASLLMQQGHQRFDEALRYTGGSDIRFTEELVKLGAHIVWADEAVTYEHVPPERCSARWALGRAYRVGNNIGRSIVRGRGHFRRTYAVASGLIRIPYAAILLFGGMLLFDSARLGNGLRVAVRGIGIVTSPFHSHDEYGA